MFSDITKPQWLNCPINMIRFTNRGSDLATPTWVKPVASDNSGETLSPTLRTGFDPGTAVKEGSYEIVYDVSDSAGNMATPCRFTVDIRGSVHCFITRI